MAVLRNISNQGHAYIIFGGGCAYKWFATEEICMILERFDTLVFIGDTMVRDIYGAFNILLRKNLDYGALSQWEITDEELLFILSPW